MELAWPWPWWVPRVRRGARPHASPQTLQGTSASTPNCLSTVFRTPRTSVTARVFEHVEHAPRCRGFRYKQVEWNRSGWSASIDSCDHIKDLYWPEKVTGPMNLIIELITRFPCVVHIYLTHILELPRLQIKNINVVIQSIYLSIIIVGINTIALKCHRHLT